MFVYTKVLCAHARICWYALNPTVIVLAHPNPKPGTIAFSLRAVVPLAQWIQRRRALARDQIISGVISGVTIIITHIRDL